MATDKNPPQQQHGEKKPGKFHYNPGNMAGKEADAVSKEEAEQEARKGRD
jgi:hypothetical protein